MTSWTGPHWGQRGTLKSQTEYELLYAMLGTTRENKETLSHGRSPQKSDRATPFPLQVATRWLCGEVAQWHASGGLVLPLHSASLAGGFRLPTQWGPNAPATVGSPARRWPARAEKLVCGAQLLRQKGGGGGGGNKIKEAPGSELGATISHCASWRPSEGSVVGSLISSRKEPQTGEGSGKPPQERARDRSPAAGVLDPSTAHVWDQLLLCHAGLAGALWGVPRRPSLTLRVPAARPMSG